MAVSVGHLSIEWKDYSNESSTLTVQLPVVTDANFVARQGEVDDFIDALEAITYGEMMKFVFGNKKQFSITKSELTASRREQKLLVSWADETAMKTGSFEIPCVNYTTLTFNPDSDTVKLDDAGVAAALVDAIEALIQSQYGNDVTVTKITAVGRNL